VIEEIAAGVAYRSATGQHHGDFEFRVQRLEHSGDGGLSPGAEGVGPGASDEAGFRAQSAGVSTSSPERTPPSK